MRLVTGPRRPAPTDAVHAAYRGDFRRSAGHEDFIRQIQGFTGQHLLADFDTKIFRQLDNGVAGNARQRGRGKRRGEQYTVLHFKQVFPCAFGDIAVNIEGDTFLIAMATRFTANQQRGKIITTGFRCRRDSVRRRAVRGRRPLHRSPAQALLRRGRLPMGTPR